LKFDVRKYGPWALVTGASAGIGEQFARHLAAAGMHLILVARRLERLQALKDELTASHGIKVEILAVDLSAPDAADRVVASVGDRDLGLIVSNAGDSLPKGKEFTADSRATLEGMFNLNARLPMLLLHGLLPRLKARGHGGVILTGSIEGEIPFPYSSTYPATKAFLHSLGQSLYGELKPAGVDVLVLAPGATATAALTRQGMNPAEMSNVMTPAEVSRQALEQLGRKPFFIAGRSNRIMIGLFRLLPRSWVIAIACKGARSMMEKVKH
jgi:short-subunit dehydrogenase